MRRHTWVWWVVAGLSMAWLLWMTVRPDDLVETDLTPLIRSANAHGISTFLLIDLAGNVAVFVPLGIALAFALRPVSVPRGFLIATLIGSALSLAIELVQAGVPGRTMAFDDWLLNTAGTALGAGIGSLVRVAIERHRKQGGSPTRGVEP
jgi:glycopeptide antibiotics resistance protein